MSDEKSQQQTSSESTVAGAAKTSSGCQCQNEAVSLHRHAQQIGYGQFPRHKGR